MKRKRDALDAKRLAFMEEFADALGDLYPDSLPVPGYYISDGARWRLLVDETDASQERRHDEMTDRTMMTLGVKVLGSVGDASIEASPALVFLP